MDELDELKKTKRRLKAQGSEQAADEYAEGMERKGNLKMIMKFMRRSLKTKQLELETLEVNIKEKVEEITSS